MLRCGKMIEFNSSASFSGIAFDQSKHRQSKRRQSEQQQSDRCATGFFGLWTVMSVVNASFGGILAEGQEGFVAICYSSASAISWVRPGRTNVEGAQNCQV